MVDRELWPSVSSRRPDHTTALLVSVTLVAAFACGVLISLFGKTVILGAGMVVVAGLLAVLMMRRRYEIVAALLVVASVMIDWYRIVQTPYHLPVVATTMGVVLLVMMCVARLPIGLRMAVPLWPLWGSFLLLAIPAAFYSINWLEGWEYYLHIMVNPLIVCVAAGLAISNVGTLRRFLQVVSGFGTLVALHTIIYGITKVFLFETSNLTNYLADKNDFPLQTANPLGNQVSRVGSFLSNPDMNGLFLASMVFVPIGLYFSSTSRRSRFVYLGEVICLLLGLMYTYSAASWMAVAVGALAFLFFRGNVRSRTSFLVLIGLVAAIVIVVFPTGPGLLLNHAIGPREAPLRLSLWHTAILVMGTYSWFGCGLGLHTYEQRAMPFELPPQTHPYPQPHNSYLEIGAMAGIPTMLVFSTLIVAMFVLGIRNYRYMPQSHRPLLGGTLVAVIVFSINSLTITGWTLPPLAVLGWSLLGAAAAPALAYTLRLGQGKEIDQRVAAERMDQRLRGTRLSGGFAP